MNAANKMIGQILSNLETGIGSVTHATLKMEWFISFTRNLIVDTITSLLGSDGKINPVSEVHHLLNKKFLYKQTCTTFPVVS